MKSGLVLVGSVINEPVPTRVKLQIAISWAQAHHRVTQDSKADHGEALLRILTVVRELVISRIQK